MKKRTKRLGLVAGALVAIGGVVWAIVTRFGRHAVTGVKIAATSTAVVTAAGPLLMTDKGVDSMGSFLSVAKFAASLTEPLRDANVGAAKEVFRTKRAELAEAGETAGPLAAAWVRAVQNSEAPEDIRRSAMEYLSAEYPLERIEQDRDVLPYAVVAGALWASRPPPEALKYSTDLLNTLSDRPEVATLAAGRIISGLRLLGMGSEELTEARRTFAIHCAGVFPADNMKPAAEAAAAPDGNTGARPADLGAGTGMNPKQLRRNIVNELLRTGAFDEARQYARSLFPPPLPNEDRPLATLASLVVWDVIRAAHKGLDRNVAIEVVALAAPQCGQDVVNESLSWLLRKLPQEESLLLYRDLLNRFGKSLASVGLKLVASSPKDATIDQVMSKHCAVLSLEVEAGVESSAFDHLVEELSQRGNQAQIRQVSEFLWRTFPAEPIGRRAFVVWTSRQMDIGGEAVVAEACREVDASWGKSSIGVLARLLLARTYVSRGQVMDALLMVAREHDPVLADDRATLNADLIGKLVTLYRAKTAEVGLKTDPASLAFGLGEQLSHSGHKHVAFRCYWDVTQLQPVNLSNPRTGLPAEPPGIDGPTGGSVSDADVRFWRALALIAMGRRTRGAEELDGLIRLAPDYSHLELAHWLLARHHYANGAVVKAWEHIQACPEDFRAVGEVSELYSKLVTEAPKALQNAKDSRRIKRLREFLTSTPNRPNADKTLMELGEILSRQGQYPEAAATYERVATTYRNSPHAPEALYRAIVTYRTKIKAPQRAKHLTAILKTRYPQSPYSGMIVDPT